jgi:O-antigen ligase
MYTEQSPTPTSPWLPWVIGILGLISGAIVGFLSGAIPLLVGVLFVTALSITTFFLKFETVVISLLCLRVGIDCFITFQLPTVFALSVNALTVLYILVQAFRKRPIQTDGFFWAFLTWWLIQGMWLVVMPLSTLGFGMEYFGESLREWIRLMSWVLVYLLVMQLKGKVDPVQFIHYFFWSLIAPISVAILQIVLPSVLPGDLNLNAGEVFTAQGPGVEGSRIRGTLGHPNGFVTYLFMFIALTQWRLGQAKDKLPMFILLGILAYFYVSTKALYSLMISVIKLVGGILFFSLILFLFGSTDFGQERLASVAKTPLLNPDMDVSRAIILSQGDGNSFNWRIAQWSYVTHQADLYPWFGYGLGTSIKVSVNSLLPHNDYVRAYVEGGIVGLSIYIGFLMLQVGRILQLMRRVRHNLKHYNFCLTLLAVFLALPIGMITENIWSHTMFFFYWYALLAIAGWDWSEEEATSASDAQKPRLLGQL